MNNYVKILSPLVGIVFLVSGIGKSVVAYEFSEILMQYGFEAFRFFAPFVIIFEVAVGLLLFFSFRPKQTSLLALCFVVSLSLVFLYGHLFRDITDCGCFGQFSFLNLSPAFTYIRNVILAGILLYIFLKSSKACKAIEKTEIMIMAGILCAVCFIAGYTYVERNNSATQYVTKGENINTTVQNSVLGEFLTTSKDSTYLVFAFTYSCPHCYNSIENLKQYERLGVVDKVLALSFAVDSVTMGKFNDLFNPDFQIKNYPPQQLFRLTNQFPLSYYIKDNTIKLEIRGVLPCGYVLQQQLKRERLNVKR